MNENNTKAALAAGLAGGYLLGRTRKAKFAFAVATYVFGRRFGLSPRELMGEGVRRMRESPQFAELMEQIRGDLADASRSAVSAAANHRINSLADALQARTRDLAPRNGEQQRGEPDERRDDQYESQPEDQSDEQSDEQSRNRSDEQDTEPEAEQDTELDDAQPEEERPGRKEQKEQKEQEERQRQQRQRRQQERQRRQQEERPAKKPPKRPERQLASASSTKGRR